MDFAIARRLMVERQVKGKGINDLAVQQAMMSIPRHNFVEEAFQGQAYGDYPLPIGEKQTISQPYIVALMTEALQLAADHKILEIGTGSGYQAAVLSRLAAKVYSLERIPALARRARKILDSIGCVNVHIRVSDGTLGWKDEAPFDGIIVTAGAPVVPETYLSQLRAGGRLVIPVGSLGKQVLKRITLTSEGKLQEEILTDCRFVPLIGANGWDSDEV